MSSRINSGFVRNSDAFNMDDGDIILVDGADVSSTSGRIDVWVFDGTSGDIGGATLHWVRGIITNTFWPLAEGAFFDALTTGGPTNEAVKGGNNITGYKIGTGSCVNIYFDAVTFKLKIQNKRGHAVEVYYDAMIIKPN